jgi:hypothetical protein
MQVEKIEAKAAPDMKALTNEKLEAAARVALAKGDVSTAMAFFALAGRHNIQRSEPVRDGNAKQAARIAAHTNKAKRE